MANENVFLLYALLCGIFITFVYDILRIFRRVIPHSSLLVSVEDLGFWAFCAGEVFMLMYRESNGTLRWFAVLGALVGMLVYKKAVSGIFVKYVSLLLQKILSVIGRILKILTRPFVIAGKGAGSLAGKAAGQVTRGRKSFTNIIKKKLTAFFKMLKMVLRKQ